MHSRRICFVVTELLGLERNGGIGTAITHMSLVLAGHGHDVEILHCGHRDEIDEPWLSRYQGSGVNVRMLERGVVVAPAPVAPSWLVYQSLKHAEFDVIVFQDWRGLGGVSAAAKRSGLAFANTILVHHVHGPTEWLREANQTVELDTDQAIVAHLEHNSAEFADAVVGPSQYLLDWLTEHGYVLPADRHVIPYFTAGDADDLERSLEPDPPDHALTELVFFGRLEERKGVRTFAEALGRLGPELLSGLVVTFLGRPAHFTADATRGLIDARVQGVAEVRFVDDLDQPDARQYLRQPGRLAVMPSHVDNSPNVVYECIEDRIPFLASHAGGTAELVLPDDRHATMFAPSGKALAEILRPLLVERRLPKPARPAFDGVSSLAAWERVFSTPCAVTRITETPRVSIVIPTHERPALLRQAVNSAARQDYSNLEIVVVDDGSSSSLALDILERLDSIAGGRPLTITRQENRYLGAARNAGVSAATGDLLVFLDDDDVAAPAFVSSLVTAALTAEADAVSCAFELVSSERVTTLRPQDADGFWIFLGGPLSVGPAVNVLGGAGMLVRRSTFEKVGGFHEQFGVGHEDWHLLARIGLAGGRIIAVPEPLYRYRQQLSSMLRVNSRHLNARAVNDAYRAVLPAELAAWPELIRGLHERVLSSEREVQLMRAKLVEAEDELALRQRYISILERGRG